MSIQVKVVDINDNPPAFSQPAYQATILEAQEVGGPVLHLSRRSLPFAAALSSRCRPSTPTKGRTAE